MNSVLMCVAVLLQPAGDLLRGAGLCCVDVRRGEEPLLQHDPDRRNPDGSEPQYYYSIVNVLDLMTL